jgi:hypothetical protein
VFDDILKSLSHGLIIGENIFYRSNLFPGRSSYEQSVIISLIEDDNRKDIMDVSFFSGIKPWYHPWIEIKYPYEFILHDDNKAFRYFDSIVEKTFIQLFCESIPAAGKIYVSYECDDETRKGLMINIPEVITRLGFLLLNNGCTWFKDWYFPEGGSEGGQKLQGERPINSFHIERQFKILKKQINHYLRLKKDRPTLSSIEKKAINRGRKVLKLID